MNQRSAAGTETHPQNNIGELFNLLQFLYNDKSHGYAAFQEKHGDLSPEDQVGWISIICILVFNYDSAAVLLCSIPYLVAR